MTGQRRPAIFLISFASTAMSLGRLSFLGAGVVGGVALSLAAPAGASPIVFFDSFNSNTPSFNSVPIGWIASDGTVDIISDFGACPAATPADSVPGGGCIIDLDGTTNDSGILKNNVSLTPGETYSLIYHLRGGLDQNSVTVTFDTSTASHTLPFGAPWQRFALPITASAANVAFSFENQGGDTLGIYLDNVSVVRGVPAEVPAPVPVAAAVVAWRTSRRLRQRFR